MAEMLVLPEAPTLGSPLQPLVVALAPRTPRDLVREGVL